MEDRMTLHSFKVPRTDVQMVAWLLLWVDFPQGWAERPDIWGCEERWHHHVCGSRAVLGLEKFCSLFWSSRKSGNVTHSDNKKESDSNNYCLGGQENLLWVLSSSLHSPTAHPA